MIFDFQQDPFENLELLIKNAQKNEIPEPTAMSLGTATVRGVPSVRTVLFKGIIRNGISFYTNYQSPKAADLRENPMASLLFYWGKLTQQIRIQGKVELLSRQENEKYFATRDRLSQLGAWASQQSQKIENFSVLAEAVKSLEIKYTNKEIPCPPHWGGYRLIPNYFEFWFGRQGRLHERYVYERSVENEPWQRLLKSP